MQTCWHFAAGVAAFLAAAGSLFGADAPRPSFTRTPLADVPDNCWRKLNPPTMAKARTYSGACFGGGYLWYFGGAHRGYKGNDVQLFDPRLGDWIQATEPEWPEVGSPDWKSMTSGGGSTSQLSPTGRPFTEHTYQQVCWQPERGRFFIVLASSGTWEFDPERREWIHLVNRFKEPDAQPSGYWAQRQVLYVPELGAPVLTISGGSMTARYVFDHDERRWRRLGPTPEQLRWNEYYATYVPEWKCHLVSTTKGPWLRYDAARGTVSRVEAPEALGPCQSLSYDAANKVVVALARRELRKGWQTVVPWALDVESMEWTELAPPKPWPEGQATGNWCTFWYDAAHNVHLVVNFVRRDRQEVFDGGVTETWAYRFR